jgi:hypothetical protein
MKEAGNKVVCSECHNIFSPVAGKTRRSRKTPRIESSDSEMQDLLEDLEHSLEKQQAANPADNSSDSGFLQDLDASTGELSLPDTQPLEDLPQSESLPREKHSDNQAAGPDTAVDIPAEEPFIPEQPGYRRKTSAAVILLSILLGLGALAQLAWLQRDRLLEYPQLYELAEKLCPYLECRLPQAAPARSFHVLDRLFEPYASHPGAYRLNLLLRNDGKSPQVPPALRLSLLDRSQQIMARRTFPASIYNAESPAGEAPLEPGKTLEVHLLLVPPQPGISGFELDLVPAGS